MRVPYAQLIIILASSVALGEELRFPAHQSPAQTSQDEEDDAEISEFHAVHQSVEHDGNIDGSLPTGQPLITNDVSTVTTSEFFRCTESASYGPNDCYLIQLPPVLDQPNDSVHLGSDVLLDNTAMEISQDLVAQDTLCPAELVGPELRTPSDHGSTCHDDQNDPLDLFPILDRSEFPGCIRVSTDSSDISSQLLSSYKKGISDCGNSNIPHAPGEAFTPLSDPLPFLLVLLPPLLLFLASILAGPFLLEPVPANGKAVLGYPFQPACIF